MIIKRLLKLSLCSAAIYAAPVMLATSVNSFVQAPLISGVSAHAEFPGCSGQVPKPRRLPAISQKLFKRIEPINALISPPEDKKTGRTPEPNFRAAYPKLQSLLRNCGDCNPYEIAQLNNLAAFSAFSLDKPKDALRHYQNLVKQSPNIPFALEQQTQYTIAQLLIASERYKEGLSAFKRWEKTCPSFVPNDYNFMLAQVYYQTGNKKAALVSVNKAIRQVEADDGVPKESMYRLKMALHVEKEDYKSALTVMEKVIVYYSSMRNWTQLAGLYGVLGRDKDQLAALDAVNVMGGLNKPGDFKNFAYLLIGADVPYLAAKIMQKGIDKKSLDRNAKNLETLAVALRQSQEVKKSIPIMEEAARKSDRGQLYATLAAIHLAGDQFKEAISTGKKALGKGGLKSNAEVHMFIGNAEMQLKRYNSAIKSLEKASSDKKYRKYALNLIKYIKSEQSREAQLKAAEAQFQNS